MLVHVMQKCFKLHECPLGHKFHQFNGGLSKGTNQTCFVPRKHESHSHNQFVSMPTTQNASHIPKTNISANVMSSFRSLHKPFLAT